MHTKCCLPFKRWKWNHLIVSTIKLKSIVVPWKQHWLHSASPSSAAVCFLWWQQQPLLKLCLTTSWQHNHIVVMLCNTSLLVFGAATLLMHLIRINCFFSFSEKMKIENSVWINNTEQVCRSCSLYLPSMCHCSETFIQVCSGNAKSKLFRFIFISPLYSCRANINTSCFSIP